MSSNRFVHFMQRIFVPFFTFIALFIGTGFVSGSIVHMGEGINPWDLSLLAIGILFFILGSVSQDMQQDWKRIRGEGIAAFLFLSLVLSIGIGMVSGGMQHFVDTPAYSAILIPLGLALGFMAFILKERIVLHAKEWTFIVPATLIGCAILGVGLRAVSVALPDSLQQGHGQGVQKEQTTSSASSSNEEEEGHGH